MQAADLALLTSPPAPLPGEGHEAYLRRLGLLDRGFAYREVVRPGSPSHVLPPPRWWRNQASALVLAHELRRRVVARGARGLNVAAAHRPQGGEPRSMHKRAAALDLDLLGSDLDRLPGLDDAYAEELAALWHELRALPVGAGTYAPEGHLWTRRAHVDYGYRWRAWQGTGRAPGGERTWAETPALVALAGRLAIAGADGPDDDPA